MSAIAYKYFDRNISRTVGVTAAFVLMTAASIVLLDMKMVAAMFVASWCILFVYRYPMLLVCLWPIVSLYEVYFPWDARRFIRFDLTLFDPIYFFTIGFLAVWGLLQPKKALELLKEVRFLSIFVLLVAVTVIVYTPINGQSAVGEARKFYFVFLFPLLALIAIKTPEDLKRLLLVVVAVAFIVACVTIFQAAAMRTIVRSSNSAAALVLAFAAFAFLMLRINKVALISTKMDTALLCLFSLLVLGAGQRSVWIAVAVGAMVLLWLYRQRAVFLLRVLFLLLTIVVGGVVSILAFPSLGSQLGGQFAGILDPSKDQNASWRLAAWESQLEQMRRGNVFFGQGLGGYFKWRYGSETVRVSPHNAYIQTTLKLGLFGLTLYGLLVFEFFRKTLAFRKKLRPGPMKAYLEMGIVAFGAAQGYMLGYDFQPVILIFFALAMSAIKLSQETLPDNQYHSIQTVRKDPRIFAGEFNRHSGLPGFSGH